MELLVGIGVFVVMIVVLVLMLIPVIAISSIVNGFVLRALWGWFIVPIFHLPSLTIAQAIGLSMVAGMLTHRSSNIDGREKTKEEKRRELFMSIGMAVLYPLITLGAGWVVHLFV